MARRLIIDTGVLVMSERGTGTYTDAIQADDDLAVAAVTVAELRAGVELANNAHRAARSRFLARLLETLPVDPHDLALPKPTANFSLVCIVRGPKTRIRATRSDVCCQMRTRRLV